MKRRALVCHTRAPAFDRDSGSQDVDNYIRFLLEDGWSVTFLSRDPAPEPRHVARLREWGVATYAGLDTAPEVLKGGAFDLVVIAFWEVARDLAPLVREFAPTARLLLYTVDLHFVRDARRSLASGARLSDTLGSTFANEINAYAAADGLIAVSNEEGELLGSLLGRRVHVVPIADDLLRSSVPMAARAGMLFVGNFRHVPNVEAVRFLCKDVIPRLPARLVRSHPLRIAGGGLDKETQRLAHATHGVQLMGWVPEIAPYFHSSKLSLMPLLHGAGVKRKVVQSLLAGTPVVTTPIGAEGLGLRNDEHAFIAEDPEDVADAAAILLEDADRWHRFAEAGCLLARGRFSLEAARKAFGQAVRDTLASPGSSPLAGGVARDHESAIRHAIETVISPGGTFAIRTEGESVSVDHPLRTAIPLQGLLDAGEEPPDAMTVLAVIRDLEVRGASHLVVPTMAQYPFEALPAWGQSESGNCRRVYYNSACWIYELGADSSSVVPAAEDRARVVIKGTHDRRRSAPSRVLVGALSAQAFDITHEWSPGEYPARPGTGRSADPTAEWTVFVDDRAIIPDGFLDEFLRFATLLGADRAQPAHRSGPEAAPPSSERLGGCIAREVASVTAIPVLAVRNGAASDGPVALVDASPVHLAAPIADPRSSDHDATLAIWTRDADGSLQRTTIDQDTRPAISVVIATYARPDLLEKCLEGFVHQSLPRHDFEIVIVDDGSPDATREVVDKFATTLPTTFIRLEHTGRSAAKNAGTLVATGRYILFFDDDDIPAPDMLEHYLAGHVANGEERIAVLGHTEWAPTVRMTPLLSYVTDVDSLMFAYGSIKDGQVLDWRYFWEGRVSISRAFLMRYGLHDQRLNYSIDVELSRRLDRHGLQVIHRRSARSFMERAPSLDDFCRRMEAKGAANAILGWLHPDDTMARYTRSKEARERWPVLRDAIDGLRLRAIDLEQKATAADPGHGDATLWGAYRALINAHYFKGLAEMHEPPQPTPVVTPNSWTPPAAIIQGIVTREPEAPSSPVLSVVIPVWSITPELATMAVATLDRLRSRARLSTEIVVVDNGSPYERRLDASVTYRFAENHGVAVAWNTGIRVASADTLAILNSDCLVEDGWDVALVEAAHEGRRIAFPYTDHDDAQGYRMADQAGTAGWCFVLTRSIYEEIGPFDERFGPAFGEDTDYWHRAWKLGIDLTPVPEARVRHARRTTTSRDPHWEWLLTAHRYKYGWKHGVEPMKAPPYYGRDILEYHAKDLYRPGRIVTSDDHAQ